jgi:hypothetical protein
LPIFGNGDIDRQRKRYNIKMNMVLTDYDWCAAIGYPWIFNEIKYFLKQENI